MKDVELEDRVARVLFAGPQREILDKYLEVLYNRKHKELSNLTEPAEIYRAQGYIQSINALVKLKDRLNAK